MFSCSAELSDIGVASHNSEDVDGKVRVVLRVRPFARHELARNCSKVVTKVCSPYPWQAIDDKPETVQIACNNNNRLFEFDAVLDETNSQQDVYVRSGALEAITEDIFRGFNCTVLAYGQSGSGKTHTMGTGGDKDDGVIPKACVDLFEQIQQKCHGNAQVRLTYMEVYNEVVRDLIPTQQGQQSLQIRETAIGEVYVEGSTSVHVTSPEQVIQLMKKAQGNRVVASTKINEVSSRSHAICVLTIQGKFEDKTFQSKLTFADLAGSERLNKTENTGLAKAEGISINKGLFVLGRVIAALADKQSGLRRKPPFRESKLTRILQDSLGGNSRTIMIACCSPADFHAEETLNSLRYAAQARNIENTLTANFLEVHISPQKAKELQEENKNLKLENQLLREKLLYYEESIGQITSELHGKTMSQLEEGKIETNIELQDHETNSAWNAFAMSSTPLPPPSEIDEPMDCSIEEAKEETPVRHHQFFPVTSPQKLQLVENPSDEESSMSRNYYETKTQKYQAQPLHYQEPIQNYEMESGIDTGSAVSVKDIRKAFEPSKNNARDALWGKRGAKKIIDRGSKFFDNAKSTFYCGSGTYGAGHQ